MADSTSSRMSQFGPPQGPQAGGITGIEITAVILTVGWLLLSGSFFVFWAQDGTDGLRFVLTVMVVFLPVALIWVAAITARASRVMREESLRLQAAIDAIRSAYVTQSQQTAKTDNGQTSIARKLDEIAAAQRKTETALALFTSTRAASARATPAAPPSPASTPPRPLDDWAGILLRQLSLF